MPQHRKHRAPQTISAVTDRADREALLGLVRDGRSGGAVHWTKSDALRSAIHIAHKHKAGGENRALSQAREELRELRAQLASARQKSRYMEQKARQAEEKRRQQAEALAQLEIWLPYMRRQVAHGHESFTGIEAIDHEVAKVGYLSRVVKRVEDALEKLGRQESGRDPGRRDDTKPPPGGGAA